MKKWLVSALMIICLVAFTACGSKDNNSPDNDNKGTSTPTETVTETPVPTEESTPEPTETPTEAPTEVPTEVPTEAPTETPTEVPTEVPTEAPIENENIRSFNDEYDYILEAYAETLSTIYGNLDEGSYTKFNLACIDDDDIPELLISPYNYHGAGVNIYKYNIEEGFLRGYEPFGTYGGCAYNPFNNRLISFDYGMGTEVLTHAEITDQGISNISSIMFNEDELKFYIDNEEVDEETYFNKYDELMEFHNTNMYFDHYMAPEYSPELDIMVVLKDMANAALNCEEYFLPIPLEVDSVDGDWEFLSATVYDSAADATMDSKDFDIASGMLYINLGGFIHFWTHFNDNFYQEYELSYNVVNEKLVDLPNYADWYYEFKSNSESTNDEYYATLFYERQSVYLLFRHITLTSDTDTLTYDIIMAPCMAENPNLSKECATIRYDEEKSDLENGYVALTATRYLTVYPDDTDLIKFYNLPEDLDGYDYEIVTPDEPDYTIYVSTTGLTYFQILDWDSDTLYTDVDYDSFIDHLNNDCMGEMCITYLSSNNTYKDGVIINSIIEDYIG